MWPVFTRISTVPEAFRELGCVIRTVYLLEFISNIEIRKKITIN